MTITNDGDDDDDNDTDNDNGKKRQGMQKDIHKDVMISVYKL